MLQAHGIQELLVHTHKYLAYFPERFDHLVVFYAGIRALQNALSSKDDDLPDDLDNIVLDLISSSLPTYTGPTSFVQPIQPAGADVDFRALVVSNRLFHLYFLYLV